MNNIHEEIKINFKGFSGHSIALSNDVDDEIAEEQATSDSAEEPEATARRRGHRGGVDVGSAMWWRARAEEQEQ